MEVNAVITLFTLFLFITSIVTNKVPVDIALFSAMVILIVSQVVTPSQALAGFFKSGNFHYCVFLCCFSCSSREWRVALVGNEASW